MKTLANPRRTMRPHPTVDIFSPACAWCEKKIGRGVPFTRGMNLGKPAIVCGGCVTPPQLGVFPAEITDEEF